MGIAGAPGGPNGTGQIPAGSMPITNPPVNNNTSMSGSNQMQPGLENNLFTQLAAENFRASRLFPRWRIL